MKTKACRGPTSLLTTGPALAELFKLDERFVGTENYMGLAYFWSYAFRHWLRDCTRRQRCRVHDAWLNAGLKLDAETDRHWEIAAKIVKQPVPAKIDR